ncbi:PepSY domain-containing protein [Shewanella sp. MF05960]|uniref:PepSY domain-containing protein n=1 Tax=Shewanella sp. MF05960 TaxID=3434874 RepID=UPI003D79C9E2
MIRWQQLHKWLGLLIGLQLLLWIVTGLLLNMIPSAWFSASMHQQQSVVAQTTPISLQITVSINDVVRLSHMPLSDIELIAILARPAYQLTQVNGQQVFVWADTLQTTTKHQQVLSRVSLTDLQIQQISRASYRGDAKLAPAKALKHDTTMPVGTLMITANDEVDTRIYVNRHSGSVIAHQNNRSDYQQWLLMLHFMDYNSENGVSFNHFWTQIIAVLSLIFAISGVRLLLYQLQQGFFWSARKRPVTVTLYDSQKLIAQISAKSGLMLDNINKHASTLHTKGFITECGGGGQCGQCVVQYLSTPPSACEYDIAKLSKRKLAQGYRLSCQHIISNANLALSPQQVSQWYEKTSDVNQ